MKHRDYIILKKIIEEVKMARNLIGDINSTEFSSDEKTKRAVGMTVINIGELVKTLTDDMRNQYKNIAWKEAAGFRDVTAHKYMTLDIGDVYKTVTEDFPHFQKQLESIFNEAVDEKQ